MLPMAYGNRGTGTPFDQEKLECVREFLRREFRGCQLRDYFEFDKSAQVFLIISRDRNVRHTLVIPRDTFRVSDFTHLLNQQLATALKLSGSLRLTLTPQAPQSRDRKHSGRFLTWRRATDRARITFVRRPLVCGAGVLALGFGACMLISSLVWDVRDPQQQASEWRLVRTATPSDHPQSAVPVGPVSASVTEQTRPEERPVVGARRTASTERPATRAQGRQDRNLPSSGAPSIAWSHDRTKKLWADPVEALRRLVGYIPKVQLGKAMVPRVAAPPADPEAPRRNPETPQSL
jgi:hypothetical protein